MINFFKKLLAKKEEEIEIELDLDDVEAWITKKSDHLTKKFEQRIKNADDQISSARSSVQDAVTVLQNAELQNKNIPPKALQVMKGNREAYVKLMTLFLRDVVPSQLTALDYGKIKEMVDAFPSEMERLTKASWKNYQVMQQFFAHESNAVIKGVKQVERSMEDLKKFITSSGIHGTEHVKKQLQLLRDKIQFKKELQKNLAEEEQRLEEVRRSHQKSKAILGEFFKSKEHFDHQTKDTKRKQLEEQLKKHKDSLIQEFSTLDKALKKMSRIAFENEALMIEYVYRPEHALVADSDLRIMTILNTLEKNIISGSIALENKKKNKSLDALRRLDKPFFENYLSHYEMITKQIQDITSELKSSPTVEKQKKIVNQVAAMGDELDSFNINLHRLKEKNDKLSIPTMMDDMESLINTTFSAKIKIKRTDPSSVSAISAAEKENSEQKITV